MTDQPNPRAERKCAGCERTFVPYREGQLFHSAKCRNATKVRQRNHSRKDTIARLQAELTELKAKLAEFEERS